MAEINTQLVEHYQLLYQKDPKSKVFAPLAEAYRRMGLQKEALEICEQGVKTHPDFASGRVAYGRILLEMGRLPDALKELRAAADLSPENILANSLLAETYLKLKMPKEALKAYKMVLFLNPSHEKAQSAVRKLESLTADEYDKELFEMKGLGAIPIQIPGDILEPIDQNSGKDEEKIASLLERSLSLADAFIVRNDIDKALTTLRKAEEDIGPHHDIRRRIDLLAQRVTAEPIPERAPILPEPKTDPKVLKRQRQIETLQKLLSHIERARREV